MGKRFIYKNVMHHYQNGKKKTTRYLPIDLTSTGIADGLSRICSQSTATGRLKNSKALISSKVRTLLSASLQNFKMVALALSEMGTSGGNINVSFHSMIFLYVSVGLSEQKGG